MLDFDEFFEDFTPDIIETFGDVDRSHSYSDINDDTDEPRLIIYTQDGRYKFTIEHDYMSSVTRYYVDCESLATGQTISYCTKFLNYGNVIENIYNEINHA